LLTFPELLIILAVSPVAFLLWFFYHEDKYKHESIRLMAVTFAFGAVATLPAAFIERLLTFVIPVGPGLIATFVYFMVGVGLVEESSKFLAVRVYAYRSKLFDEPMDGIVLGVCAGLGFATVENVLYVLHYGIIDAIVRGLVSVPGHALYGAIVGFYLGEAKLHGKPALALKGLIIAAFLHGAFDTIANVFSNLIGIVILAVFVWIVYTQIVRKEIKEAETESPHRPFS